MKYKASLLLTVMLCMPLAAHVAHAETVLRVGENISVDANQVVDGDYYVFVGPLSDTIMSGKVDGDMYSLGGQVTVNGTVANDLFIVGGVSLMNASVTDDVRIVGGEVTIGEHIGGDLFVVGGVLKVLSTASIDGNVFFFGKDAEIDGKVGGSVMGTAEKIGIDSEIGGDVDVKTATHLTLGDKAKVAGFVHYASLNSLVRAPNASVEGEVTQTTYGDKGVTTKTKVRDILVPVFITLFATLSLFLLFRNELQTLVEQIQKSSFKSAVFGLGVLILGPIVALLLTITVLGMLLGIISAALLVLVYVVGYALTGVLLGAYIFKLFTRHMKVSLLSVVVGTLCLQLLFFIPVVGMTVFLLLFAMTVGGLAVSTYKLLS